MRRFHALDHLGSANSERPFIKSCKRLSLVETDQELTTLTLADMFYVPLEMVRCWIYSTGIPESKKALT